MRCLFVFTSALMLLLCGLSASSAQEVDLPMAVADWAPYVEEAKEGHGAIPQIVAAAAKAAGLSVSYTFLPWRRVQNNVAEGHFFGTFPFRAFAERKAHYYFSCPLIYSEIGLLRHTANALTAWATPPTTSILKGRQVGVETKTVQTKTALEEAGAEVHEAATAEQNLNKLLLDRIEYFAGSGLALKYALKNYDGSKSGFEYSRLDLDVDTDLHILVSKKYPDALGLLKRFNAGLAAIMKSGEYHDILNRHDMLPFAAPDVLCTSPEYANHP